MRPEQLCPFRKTFSPHLISAAAQLFTTGCGDFAERVLATG
jgi:hypothetical protein